MSRIIKKVWTAIIMAAILTIFAGAIPVNAAVYTSAGLTTTSISSNKTYYIISKGNMGLALDACGGGTSNGTRIWLYSYNSTAAQQYRFRKNSDGTYTIVNARSGKALDIKGGSKANGAVLQLYQSNGTNAQKWTVKKNSDGTVTFVNKGSRKAIDVPGASFQSKKYLQQYTANGTKAQSFYLVDASTANGYVDATQVYTLLNQFRRANGKQALQRVTALDNSAKVRAKECVQRMDATHRRPNGAEFYTAVPSGYTYYSENTCAGYEMTAATAIAEWKASPGHRESMLESRYRYVGVAGYRYNGKVYWVQEFTG